MRDKTQSGSNLKDIKLRNRLLLLKLLSTQKGISRVDLAKKTGLSKVAVGKIISDLIAMKYVYEEEASLFDESQLPQGRPAIRLKLSNESPCICGMLVKRSHCTVILADLSGCILEQEKYIYHEQITERQLLAYLFQGYQKMLGRGRNIIAVGIAANGPLSTVSGTLLNPTFICSDGFYYLPPISIVSQVKDHTGLPVLLCNDANTGALAEKLYGAAGSISDFGYINLGVGIGAGFVLNHRLYNGFTGLSGEIGHTSINFNGPSCFCGNKGCLETYACADKLREHINSIHPFLPRSSIAADKNLTLENVIDAANSNDPVAVSALDEYCNYVCISLVNVLNLLDLTHIFVGYRSTKPGSIVESMLERKVNSSKSFYSHNHVIIAKSSLGENSTLIGSIALVADQIFNGETKLNFADSDRSQTLSDVAVV